MIVCHAGVTADFDVTHLHNNKWPMQYLLLCPSSLLYNNYFFTAPSAAPTSVSVSEVTSSSVTVQWGTVDCIHHNGDITGYSVRYMVQGNDSTRQTVESIETEFTITGLEHSTSYTIQIAAVNSAGSGVYSEPLSITTTGNNSCIKWKANSYKIPQGGKQGGKQGMVESYYMFYT